MKKYLEFVNSINESSGKNFIDIFDADRPFGKPVDKVHRDKLIEEIENLLDEKKENIISTITVFAEIPTQGSKRASYLTGILPDIKKSDEEEEEVEKNYFVDSEFEVIGVDKKNNLIVAMPYSLRKKGITTPIDPKYVSELSYKNVKAKDVN